MVDLLFGLTHRLSQVAHRVSHCLGWLKNLADQVQACAIHFMGLWDTVKSYGGLKPVMLPHLRHNPSVMSVRHALALDERRAWFEATTWGWLDSDRRSCASTLPERDEYSLPHAEAGPDGRRREVAADRLDQKIIDQLNGQDVAEVWFKGSHSDIGGGNGNRETSDIALRWMLREAAEFGLMLNDQGRRLLAAGNEPECPKVKDPRKPIFGYLWRALDRWPRQVINNLGKWPKLCDAVSGPVVRQPCKSVRNGEVLIHTSARSHFESNFAPRSSSVLSVKFVQTRPIENQGQLARLVAQ